ncbi:hypothetical protein [Microbacterium lacus]|uniref:hypothetical protein n=1 Tax=Microbacterium lacus TaxID=415217 RepID=UPI000C2B5CC4|nr:hypothetical protein [Microbacterium lacus]
MSAEPGGVGGVRPAEVTEDGARIVYVGVPSIESTEAWREAHAKDSAANIRVQAVSFAERLNFAPRSVHSLLADAEVIESYLASGTVPALPAVEAKAVEK